jgi:putative PIG3 family NAD(P)H quinone oxidoreductase
VRLLRVTEEGGSYKVRLEEAPEPVPAAGEVLMKVAASGLNRADLSQIAGRYPPPPGEPEILGLEASGALVSSGEEVCALLAGGGHAEYAAVPEGQLLPCPRKVDLLTAAGIPEVWATAFLNLVLEGGLKAGDRVLIQAGASGVGLAAVQLARLLEAHVAATTRSPEKLKALEEAGAELALDSRQTRFDEEIARRWGPDSVDLVLDPVGGETLAKDLNVLAPGGRIIFLATMAGRTAELDLAALMKKRGRLIGSTLRSRSRAEKASILARFRKDVLPHFESGRLRVTVDSVFSPAEAGAAFERMRQNKNSGKILINWRMT